MNKEKFGGYLSTLRKKNGLTQAELAEKIHVTDKAISKWERGIGLPDINNIEPLADALGVNVVKLMNSEDNELDHLNNQTEVDAIKLNDSNEQSVEAVKNTIMLARLQKKRLKMKIVSAFMIYIAIKAVWAMFIDSTAMTYNNLPIIVVYILFAIYIIATCVVTFKAFSCKS